MKETKKVLSTAEKLAEDTFVLLGIKKPKNKGKSSFKTWLYTKLKTVSDCIKYSIIFNNKPCIISSSKLTDYFQNKPLTSPYLSAKQDRNERYFQLKHTVQNSFLSQSHQTIFLKSLQNN